MLRIRARRQVQHDVLCAAGLLLLITLSIEGAERPRDGSIDLVAIGIVDGGRAILVATPGLQRGGRVWRYRSFDTSDLPQPVIDVVLSTSGTKLFIQSAAGPGAVLDLLRPRIHGVPLEYVDRHDLAGDGQAGRQSHRLSAQRFVSLHGGLASVIDDAGTAQPDYPVMNAIAGAVSEEGVALYVLPDGAAVSCGEIGSSRSECRRLPVRLGARVVAVSARSERRTVTPRLPRFLLLTGTEDRTYIVDPDRDDPGGTPMRRAEAALRACLLLHSVSMADRNIATLVDTLVAESARTAAAQGRAVTDWRFFRIHPDAELYAPVLQFARLEPVFPSAFDTLEDVALRMSARAARIPAALYDRYLRLDLDARRQRCTLYFWTRSTPGSWIIEYWLYYPFDVGGLGSHLHDPEHIFVEVDKLGGAVRKIIGAGHGYMAGNNVYSADKRGAYSLTLPLYAIVELGKHATAPDIDRDGVFTPGVDENEYRERAMIWGVRDAIGTINNEVLAYDTTMSGVRRPEDSLASETMRARFPGEQDFRGRASCRLQPLLADEPRAQRLRLSDFIILPPCHEHSKECAQLHITSHPDFLDVRTVLKEWSFPHAFVRATYGLGPRRGLHTAGVGYAIDLGRVPAVGRFVPLPGRVGADVFYWHQDLADPDTDSCLGECRRVDGVGWALRYEQFISNLFGIFSAVRSYSPPVGDAWITFGPLIEAPLGKHSNVSVAAGLSFRPSDSPRFELRVSAGLWKPKTNHVGLRAASDDGRN